MTKPKRALLGPTGLGALTWFDGDVLSDWPAIEADLGPQIARHGLEPGPLLEWLRLRVARTRVHVAARASMAQRTAVMAWLQEAANDVPKALADGRLRKLPAWHAEPAVFVAAARRGHQWAPLLQAGDAAAIEAVLRAAHDSLGRQRSNRGRPKAIDLDQLLDDLARELHRRWSIESPDIKRTTAQANMLAAEILARCRVAVADDDSLARSRRRARRSISVLPRS